jgi:hypothetical protein
MTRIVDTNIILIANEQHADVGEECIKTCTLQLLTITRSGRVAIDDGFRILSEYQNKTDANRGNRPGDAFLKWVLRNKANPTKCDQVPLKDHPERGFESFPDDLELKDFDTPDRKFVAVACAHPQHPPILEAADSKWLGWAEALKRHGVKVVFVCEEDIHRFQQRKAQKKQR